MHFTRRSLQEDTISGRFMGRGLGECHDHTGVKNGKHEILKLLQLTP